MNFFRDGQTWLADVLKTYLSIENPIEFEYGDTGTTVDLTGLGVCVGQHPEVIDTADNAVFIDVEQRDYLIPVELLSRMPQPQDKIRETINGVQYEFIGSDWASRPAGRFSMRNRIMYRFTTLQIAVL